MSSDPDFAPPSSRHGALCFFFIIFLIPYAAAQPNPTGPEDPYQYARFSPAMAIIVVVLIGALFFMAFFSIYIRHCNDGTGSVRPIAGAAGVRSRRASAAARGLDSTVIEKFPILAYSAVKDLKIGKGALECAVCLSEFDDDETLRLLPKCDHVFHPDCIDAWLASHTTCPVCRADLVPETSADVDAQHESTADPESSESADDRVEVLVQEQPVEPVVMNRNSTRGSRSGRPRKFPRSHSTGHSLVQPGEDTERFTLRLPVEVRKQIMANRLLNRATSMVVLPREGSSRRGYRGGGLEGSSRGGKSYRRLDSFGLAAKSARWVFTMAPPFFVRESSMKSPKLAAQEASESSKAPSFFTRAFSIRLPRQLAVEEGTSGPQNPQSIDSARPPV